MKAIMERSNCEDHYRVLNYIRQTCELELEEDITRPKVGYVLLFNQINVRLDKQSMKPANTGLIDEITGSKSKSSDW